MAERKLKIGIIPDGNREFARHLGIPLEESYRLGAQTGANIVSAIINDRGIDRVVFYALAQNNITFRPEGQVRAILSGIDQFLGLIKSTEGINIETYGQVTNPEVAKLSDIARTVTSPNPRLRIDLLLGYSLEWDLETRPIRTVQIPPLDLVIRTCQNPHLSGFLPLQSAYAQLYFEDCYWGDFTSTRFRKIVSDYRGRFMNTISGA